MQPEHEETSLTSVAPARIRKVLDRELINAAIEAASEPHALVIAEYKAIEKLIAENQDVEKNTALLATKKAAFDAATKQQTLLSKEKIRFSKKAPFVIACLCDEITREILTHGISKLGERKKLSIKHLYESDLTSQPYHALYSQLPAYRAKWAAHHEAKHQLSLQEHIDVATKEARAAAYKECEKKLPKSKPVVKQPAVKPPKSDEPYLAFKVYVGYLIEELKKDEKYKSVEFSGQVRAHLAEILQEYVRGLAPALLTLLHTTKNKTINVKLVLALTEMACNYNHAPLVTLSSENDKLTKVVTYPTSHSAAILGHLNKKIDELNAELKAKAVKPEQPVAA